MKKILLISFLLTLSIIMIAQNKNSKYDAEWKKVADYEKNDLPKSALKEVEIILQKAIGESNNQQVIKALIHKNLYKKEINIQDKESIFIDLQNLLAQTSDIAEKALLNSMIAELYLDYLQNDRWSIKRRTALSDFVPDDMKEWSQNIFENKIIDYLDLSVKEVHELKKHTTKEYEDIIALGKDGQTYYPTLYDFLMDRAILISQNLLNAISDNNINFSSLKVTEEQLVLPADEFVNLKIDISSSKSYQLFNYYQLFLSDLQARNLTPTIIQCELNKVDFLTGYSNKLRVKQKSIYEDLFQKYRSNPASVEIIAYIVNYSEYNKEKYDWNKKGIEEYPDYKRINLLKNSLESLEQPTLQMIGKSLFSPDSTIQIQLSHKNLQQLGKPVELKLYSINLSDKETYIKSFNINLTSINVYTSDTINYDFGKLLPGHYRINHTINRNSNKKESYNYDFYVTRFAAYSRAINKIDSEIIVVDRITGKPIEGVTVEVYPYQLINKEWEYATSPIVLKTDKLGTVIFKRTTDSDKEIYRSNVGRYTLTKDDDKNFGYLDLDKDYRYSYNQNVKDSNAPTNIINIFTDRSIYRPGQTVYYKAIFTSGNELRVRQSVIAKLLNRNGEIVSEKNLQSNEFGSVAGEFILPKSGLNGYYRISIDNASTGFNVEEYKRPTFEITFDKIEKTYSLGEEVTVKGHVKNFSGVSLQNSIVSYTIGRGQFAFWRYNNPITIDNGTVKTANDGSFEITFVPQADDNSYDNQFPIIRENEDENIEEEKTANKIYNFTIRTNVTDINGETQSNNFSVIISDASMVINIDIPDRIEKTDNSTVNIEAMNLNEQKINTSGTYAIYSLDENNKHDKELVKNDFTQTGEQIALRSDINKLASGKYKLVVNALDDKKQEVKTSKVFILYSFDDKKPPIKGNSWIVVKNDTIAKGRNGEIVYGVSDKDVFVLYQVYDNSKVYERRFVKLSAENKKFVVPFKDEYKDEINVTFTLVRYDEFSSKNIVLHRVQDNAPDTDLDVKLAVFRDKLRPGDEENWTMSIKDKKGNAIDAELLASMYDISLDNLYSTTKWNFRRQSIYKEYQYAFNYKYLDYNITRLEGCNIYFPITHQWEVKPIDLDYINWFGYIPNIKEDYFFLNASAINTPDYALREESLDYNKTLEENATLRVAKSDAQPVSFAKKIGAGSVQEGQSTAQIRQNFNETAFFYPQLRTNDKGETLVSFKVPDSNTTWKFRAFAHDKDLKTGQLEQLVVSRKELMITPNMPRFIRQGDKTSISTKISNLTKYDMSGDVSIEFFDPVTDKLIDLNIANQKQSFYTESESSSSATWTFDVPTDIEMLGCRIIAKNESFSDGEQHALVVLPNRMLVTETMPFDVVKGENNTFIFENLYNNNSSTLSNYRLTLEFSGNPAWYAIQSLPVLSNPVNENAINWFASYYANSLGVSIMKQYPRVATMIQNWKIQSSDKNALVSQLNNNEELKNILLEETPWVLDAKNETEQMQRLSLLFDLNNNNQVTTTALNKLKELQTGEGGWSWYKEMNTSRSITQYILYGFAQLQLNGKIEYGDDVKIMQIDALKYIDRKILEDYNNLQKNNDEWKKANSISSSQLEYLYVRSFYRNIPIDMKVREAERFYTNIASKNWKQLDLYQRSILVVLLHRNGDKARVENIVNSIREHAITDKKFGMYWPNLRNNAFMSMDAVTIHTFLMDALKETGSTVEEMNNLKRWLITQKRTQQWESTHATIDAINAILGSGSDWFSSETQSLLIMVDSITLDPNKIGEEGTGYFKTSWDKSEISNNMGKVVATQVGDQPAYGAMYWQYYEDLNNVKKASGDMSSLQINKQLFKEVQTDNKKTLMSITESNPLNVGDKVIVRLTINAGKDMDFVQLKDMRASCFEPLDVISGMRWQDKLMYYQTTKDASTNFFFDFLPKGTYVLEYPIYVTRTGEYANGITTIQCTYAPEYISQTSGIKVIVKDK